MISVVTFDFFQPLNYIDIVITETEPWSPMFAFLRYDSLNFIDGMGSILIIGLFQLIIGIIAVIVFIVKWKPTTGRKILQSLHNFFQPLKVFRRSTIFIVGCFFEILACVSISMRMLSFYDYFTWGDKISIALQFLFFLAIVIFILFVIHFTTRKASQLVTVTKANRLEARKENLEKVWASFNEKAKARRSQKTTNLNRTVQLIEKSKSNIDN